METEIYKELSGVTLFFVQLMATEIITSMFFIIQNGKVRSTATKRYISTTKFLIGLLLIFSFVFILGRIFDEPIIKFLAQFENILIPMLISSIFFDLFYATKVILGRKWQFRVTLITLAIFLIFLIVSIVMILNDNELLQELQRLLGTTEQVDQ